MEKFLVIVECAIECQDRLLLIKRPKGVHAEGMLAFPGGKVEYNDGGENRDILLQAVKREVMEEVGLDLIDPIRFVTSSYFTDSRGVRVLCVVFHCKLKASSVEVKASSREVPEYGWYSHMDAVNHENTPVWLKHYISLLTTPCATFSRAG